MARPNGNNLLGISINIPEKSQAFMTFVLVGFGTALALGLGALFFKSIDEPPFGGLWIDNWQIVSIGSGLLSAFGLSAWRALMRRIPSTNQIDVLNATMSLLCQRLNEIDSKLIMATQLKEDIAYLYGRLSEPLPKHLGTDK